MKIKRQKTEIYEYQIRNPKIIYEPTKRIIDVSGTVINKDFPDLTSIEFRYGILTFLYWRPLTGPDHELEHRLYPRCGSRELAFQYLFVCRRNDPIFKVDRIDVRIETNSKNGKLINTRGVYVSVDTSDEGIKRLGIFKECVRLS